MRAIHPLLTPELEQKIIFKFPVGQKFFTAMWAQISGMADCCGAGVIGRLSGQYILHPSFRESDIPTLLVPFKSIKTLKEYITVLLPSNKLFAGTSDWLHWAILEDLLYKATVGRHTPQLKADSINSNTFDFENNSYHKFWAGPGYKVKMWFLTDRVAGSYMSHADELRVIAFIDFIKKNNLGELWESGDCPGSYGIQKLRGYIFLPNFTKIRKKLPNVINTVNTELAQRWETILPHIKNSSKITDKVARQW